MAALMIQGCGSDVGKSVLVAGLCRLYANRGLTVRPFKPQNMSNNAAVTEGGGEIGRAQALQAIACRTPPTVDMNPVLLKPTSDVGAQVVVLGKVAGNFKARGYQDEKPHLLGVVLEAFDRLKAQADLVIVEGAGSPAEINLRAGDIANMGFAIPSKTPVILVGDIDRGHVIAALAGAKAVLNEADSAMIRGFIVNKFRGDASLFDDGRTEIVRRTGWPDIGMVPWLHPAARLPAEDAVILQRVAEGQTAGLRIAVPMLSRISNFDDFDPFKTEPGVDLVFVPPGSVIPADADLIVIPGTKATIADLAFLRAQGWDIDIAAHVRRGGRLFGICGGYQMLGRHITDPFGIEGPSGAVEGLGFLDVETQLMAEKVLRPATGRLTAGAPFAGYEIHAGQTTGPGTARPFLTLDGAGPDGAVSADGRIAGAYVHGLFDSAPARTAILADLGVASSGRDQERIVDEALDEIAAILETSLDIETLSSIAGLRKG